MVFFSRRRDENGVGNDLGLSCRRLPLLPLLRRRLLRTVVGDVHRAHGGTADEDDEKEDGDTEGPLTLAVLATKDIDSENQMQLVWITSSVMLEDAYNQYSSDANEDFVLNALEKMCEKEDSVSVRSKSLSYEYLTVSTGDASMIKIITIGIIPAAYLAVGIVTAVRRKRR